MRDANEIGAAEGAVNAVAQALGDLDVDRAARIEAARAVARQLDRSSYASTGSGGLATAALSKELRSILDELGQQQRDADWSSLVDRLVGDDA